MAFTATIQNIQFQSDNWNIVVIFNDSVTNWTANKTYSLPSNTTQTQAITQITADGNLYKARLVANAALQSRVGSVITI